MILKYNLYPSHDYSLGVLCCILLLATILVWLQNRRKGPFRYELGMFGKQVYKQYLFSLKIKEHELNLIIIDFFLF